MTARSAPFRDRRDAGRALAEHPALASYRGRADTIVLALPRGGVPVGYELARALDLPLDVFVVRKLGVPGHEELAMGAIAGVGTRVIEPDVVGRLGLDEETISDVAARERRVLEDRERLYRGDLPPIDIDGRTVILVDDGLATGSTVRAATRALRTRNPASIVVAVPVAPDETCREMGKEADDVVCASTPELFLAVSTAYERFGQTTDEEVVDLLERSRQTDEAAPSPNAAW
jgi:putative phosphoribosyl transferase